MSNPSTTVYGACTIKRARRTKTELRELDEAIVEALTSYHPMSIRQLYYVLVSRRVIDKTDPGYQAVIRRALHLRQTGVIRWDWIVDATRWIMRPKTYGSLHDALRAAARLYRRSLWDDSPALVEIWCESLSIAGIIADETDAWDVPLFPGKGYASHSFLHDAAMSIAERKRPTYIYLFGDYDPSGQDIIRHVRENLNRYAPGADIRFATAAVTPEQIGRWGLPGHPPKKNDSRNRRYGIAEAVELEAIPPERVCELVRECITRHIDADAYRRLQTVEAAEKETLKRIAFGFSEKRRAEQ